MEAPAEDQAQDSIQEIQPRSQWLDLAQSRLSTLDNLLRNESSYYAFKEAREQLSVELDDLDRIRSELIARHNALQPIAALPLELLRRIFSFAARLDPPVPLSQKLTNNIKVDLGWIKLLHVCSHWRTVGLSYPRLWEQVCSLPLGVDVFMERSRPMSIVAVFIQSKYADLQAHAKAYRAAVQEMDRVKEINIVANQRILSQLLDMCRTQPAPQLRSLLLDVTCDKAQNAGIHQLSEDLFMGNAPNLRQIVLTDCSIPWTSPLLKGLRRLQVSFSNNIEEIPSDAMPTLPQLLGVLQKMPRLETLTLIDSVPVNPREATDISTLPTVELPRLWCLQLTGDAHDCAALMNQLRTPKLQAIEVDCPTDDRDGRYMDVITLVAARLSSRSHQLTDLKFHYHDEWFVIHSVRESFALGHPVALRLNFHSPGMDAETCTSLIDLACRSFDTTLVRDLNLRIEDLTLDLSHWLKILPGQFKNVEKAVVASQTITHEFFGSLGVYILPPGATQPPACLADAFILPQLKTLTLRDVDLMAVNSEGEAVWETCYHQLEFRRQQLDRGVERLFVEACTVSLEAVRQFTHIVPAVLWDRVPTRTLRPAAGTQAMVVANGLGGAQVTVTHADGTTVIQPTHTVHPNGMISTEIHIPWAQFNAEGPVAIHVSLSANGAVTTSVDAPAGQ